MNQPTQIEPKRDPKVDDAIAELSCGLRPDEDILYYDPARFMTRENVVALPNWWRPIFERRIHPLWATLLAAGGVLFFLVIELLVPRGHEGQAQAQTQAVRPALRISPPTPSESHESAAPASERAAQSEAPTPSPSPVRAPASAAVVTHAKSSGRSASGPEPVHPKPRF